MEKLKFTQPEETHPPNSPKVASEDFGENATEAVVANGENAGVEGSESIEAIPEEARAPLSQKVLDATDAIVAAAVLKAEAKRQEKASEESTTGDEKTPADALQEGPGFLERTGMMKGLRAKVLGMLLTNAVSMGYAQNAKAGEDSFLEQLGKVAAGHGGYGGHHGGSDVYEQQKIQNSLEAEKALAAKDYDADVERAQVRNEYETGQISEEEARYKMRIIDAKDKAVGKSIRANRRAMNKSIQREKRYVQNIYRHYGGSHHGHNRHRPNWRPWSR